MSEDIKPDSLIPLSGGITAEHVAKINLAMESSKGDRSAAAEILGIPRSRIAHLVNNNAALLARWGGEARAMAGEVNMNPITSLNRSAPSPLALTDSQRVAAQLTVSEKKLNKSLSKLGFKQNEIDAISAVEEFAGEHFQETLSIMHGTMLQSGMRLMLLAKKIENDYLLDDNLEERDRRWWWDCYFKIIEQMRGMNTETNKAALTRAIIDIKRKEQNGLGKPGFSTPTVAIQINNSAGTVKQTSGQSGEPSV